MQQSRLRAIYLLVFISIILSVHQWFNVEKQYSLHEYPKGIGYPHTTYVDVEETGPVPIPVPVPPPPPLPVLCQPNECSTGKWVFRTSNPSGPGPFTSLSQVQSVYANLWHPPWEKCPVIYDPVTGREFDEEEESDAEREEKKKLEGERFIESLNWEWAPDRGLLLDYDPVEFVVRLLKSPGGLVLIGDSITRQHWHAIYYTFRHLNITFDSNPKHLPLADHPNVEQFVLSKSSAMTKILQAKAGVPQSRMERPFFTLFEDHMLLSEEEILEITKKNTMEGFNWNHKWRRVDKWEDHLKWLTMPRDGEEEAVGEDTLIMINTGAHWSSHELSMLRAPTDAEERLLVTDTYTNMIDLVIARLSPFSRTSIYYRSTAPGHPQCNISQIPQSESEYEYEYEVPSSHSNPSSDSPLSETKPEPEPESKSKSTFKFNFPTPYQNISSALFYEQNLVQRLQDMGTNPGDKKARIRWDWDLFEVHNGIWRRKIEGMERQGGTYDISEGMEAEQGQLTGAKWYYFDIWDMSLQRPDAHEQPGKDCLHWCLPSVFDEWTKLFHHRVRLEESKNESQDLSGL